MAVKPTLDLFGGLNLFQTPQVTLDREVASLFETSKMSAAAQEAYNEMQARAKVNAQNAENVLKQQEAYQQQVAREHEESTRRLAEAIKERQRREEEARKEAEKAAKEAEKAKKEQAKALEKDPTLLVKSNISAFLEDESYKKAGDLRRAHMMKAETAKITEALKAQGHDEATIKKSVSAFEAAVQSDINRYKKEADSGFFRAAWDVISSVGSAFNNVQTGNASRDGQLITEAASDLLSGKTASGWAFDEISDRIPRAKWKKYVEKETNWGLDSFSSFRLRPGLTAAEKAEFSALVNEALKGTEQDLAKHTKERDFWQSQQSAEQQREMDNMAFEKEQAAAKYDNKEPPFLSSEWFSQALEMASISAKYPNTMLVDQSGNLLIEVGASAVATAVQGTATAALAATGVGVPAAIATGVGTGATAVRVANGLAKFGKALTKLPSTATGMAVAGKLTASDTINSARETILQADTAKLAESNPELWQQLLELSGGNEELAKQRLATMKAGDQYSQAFVLGAATHIIGPEALLARATTRALSRTAAEAARTSVGGTVARAVVSTASEGVEEGYTQYLTNKAIASALPDHDLMTGVADAVGSGIAVGGMVSGVAGATSLYGNARTAVEREQRASAIEVLSNENVQVREEQYASVTNFKDLRSTIVTQMEDFERENSQAFANDPETLKQNRQAYYDTLVDTPSVMGRLSVSEQRELREVVKQAFNGTVNTNPYAPAQDTPFMQALRNKEETPQGETIADVWRLVHNKDLGNVKNVRLATSLHKLYAELFPNQKAVDETTRQRADRLITIVNKMAEDDPTLSDAEKTTLLRTSAVLFDSNRRRLGEHDATTQNEATRAGTNQRTPETDGTGRADKGSTTSTQEPSPTANRGQATVNSESGGDGGTQQTTESSSSTGATTADSTSPVQDVSGAREAPQTETPTDPAGTPNVFSETPASTGSAEPATESSGPVIVTNAPATTTSTGSGVVGDTTTERSADGTSITPATETNTLGGNDGNPTETRSSSVGTGTIGTEVRSREGNLIGYRRAGEETFTSYRTQQFRRVTLKERGVFVRMPMSMLMGDADLMSLYVQNFSDGELQYALNRVLSRDSIDARDKEWLDRIYLELERRNLPVKPIETAEQELPLVERTLVADSLGMVLSRDGKDGIVAMYKGDLTFIPYDGSVALVLDNPDATLASMGLAEAQAIVKRPKKYLKRLQRPRTANIGTLLGEIHKALDVKQSVFSFERQPTAVKQGVVKSEEQLDRELNDNLDIIDNLLGNVSETELLDFLEFTIAGKLYNNGEFNELSREDQVRVITALATELLNDPNTPAVTRAVRNNRAEVQAEDLSNRIAQAGVATDMVWLDIYSRFNRNEVAKLHGKTNPMFGTADLIKEIRSITHANTEAQRRVFPDTMASLNSASNVTLDTLVNKLNDPIQLGLLETETVNKADVVRSLLSMDAGKRNTLLTRYSKLVPKKEQTAFRTALTALVRDIHTSNDLAKANAIEAGSKPAYKRESPKITVSTTRLTSKTKQEKPNETQNATSEQSTPAEVTAIENGQNDVGDVSSTDDKAGTVRGPNPKKTGSTQRETPDEVTEGNDDSDTKSDNSEARAEPEQGKSATKTTPKKTGEAPKTVSESDVTKQPAEGATLTNDIATLEGTTPSEQVAVVLPLPANDGTAVTRVNVPEGTHTDAEQRADATFDTEYSDARSAEGYSMADIALALAEAAGVFSSEPVETVRLRSRKKGNGPQTTQAKQKRAKHKARKDKVYANENELIDAVNEQLREITNEQNNNMAEWLQFLSETDNNRQLAKFFSVFVPFKNEIDDIMMDTSHHAARAKITDYWWWDKKRGKPELEGKKFGVVTSLGQKVGSHLAGITPLLDDYMNKLGPDVVPRTGVAQDSSVVSVSLAKIEGTKQTVYGHIHNAYVQPVIDILNDMTAKYSDADTLSTDFGNYANYRHMRVSGVEHFFRNGSLQKSEYAKKLEERLNELSRFKANNLDAILTDDSAAHTFANTLDGSEKTEFNSLLKRYKALKKDADKHDKDFEFSRKVFYGEVPRSDYPNVKLPNGMTQAELNEDMKALEAKYSKEDLDKVAELIYRGFSGIRVTGAGFGVHDSAALKHFNDAKLKDYVYLGHTKEDNPNEFEEQVITPAIFDYLDDVTISEQYETLGLAKDLSRYSRQGSRTRADDAITNLGRSARNMAGRAASQEFEQNIQRLFEGTLASDNADAVPTPDTVKSYKRSIVQKGAVDGIVRIRADLPSKHIPKEFSTIVPLTAKGWDYNDNGERELVTYRYYFTDPRIQNELTHKVTVDSTFDKNKIISSMRSLTRIKASFMTARNPVWNFWNFENEYWERMTTIALRPVVNDEGKRVSGTKLAMSFTKEIGALSVDLGAQREIYDYLTTRERRTPLQQELHRLYLSGTIQLMTDLTDKFDFLGEQERSPVDNFINNVSKATQRQAKKSALAGKVVEGASDFSDWYHRRIAEVPQVVSALAMHRAYRQNGVNRAEANHRVRDMFDPMRTKSNFMQRLANFFPFIRSAGAGNYNTMRTFGDVFMRDGWKGKAKLAVLASANVGVLFALSALSYREDEDGNDILAQMSLTDLARGIPIKLSDDTVLFIPTGHGVARFMWGVAVAVYKWLHGTISEMEVTTHIAEMTLKNISPLQLPTEESLSASGGETVALSMVPNLMLPVAEVLMNRDTFSGREIISSRTPSGERDSDQDNFATPETFKDGAKTLFKGTGGTLDVRPETLHHLTKNTLNVGPFRAIDAVLQDKGEKTQGGFMSKGEAIGPLATLLGIGTGVSTHTLSVEGRYFDLVDATNSVLSKYNVPRTMPSGATYEKTDISDISMHHVNLDRATRAERVAHQLKLAGASREEIQLAVNMLATEQKVKDAKNDMRTKGLSVYNSSRKGTETPYTQEDVVQSVDAVKNLYRDLVIENNQFAYGKK